MKIVYVHPILRNKPVVAALVALGYLLLLLIGFYFSSKDAGGIIAGTHSHPQIESFTG